MAIEKLSFHQWLLQSRNENEKDREKRKRFERIVRDELGLHTAAYHRLVCSNAPLFLIDEYDKLGRDQWAANIRNGVYDKDLLGGVNQFGKTRLDDFKKLFERIEAEQPAPQRAAAPKPEPAQPQGMTYTITTTDPIYAESLIWLANLMQSDEDEGAGLREVGAVTHVVNLLTDKYVAQQSSEEDDRILVIGMERLIERIRTYDPAQT